MIVKFTGKHYHGTDEETKKTVHVKANSVVEISDKMAERLEKQFPNQWEEATQKDLDAFNGKVEAKPKTDGDGKPKTDGKGKGGK